MTDSIYNDDSCKNCGQLERWCECEGSKSKPKHTAESEKPTLAEMLEQVSYIRMYDSDGLFFIEAKARKTNAFFARANPSIERVIELAYEAAVEKNTNPDKEESHGSK